MQFIFGFTHTKKISTFVMTNDVSVKILFLSLWKQCWTDLLPSDNHSFMEIPSKTITQRTIYKYQNNGKTPIFRFELFTIENMLFNPQGLCIQRRSTYTIRSNIDLFIYSFYGTSRIEIFHYFMPYFCMNSKRDVMLSKHHALNADVFLIFFLFDEWHWLREQHNHFRFKKEKKNTNVLKVNEPFLEWIHIW